MTRMTDTPLIKFPRTPEIKRAIAAVTKAGVVVGSIEISPSGALRIYAATGNPEPAANDFDEWERRGAL